jgi:uncharacterized protein (TIGR02001 family)
VIALADRTGSPFRGTIVKAAGAVFAGASLTFSTAGGAQVGALVSAYSDYRFRGVSLSDGRPVALLDLSYDLPGGFYAALSGGALATRDEGPQFLGYSVNGGYAVRLNSSLSGDLGVVHSAYSHYSGLAGGRSYTEIYWGVAGKLVSARLSISPNYLGNANWTAYAEVNGHVDLSRRAVIEVGAGALSALGGSYHGQSRPQFDARIGVGQRLGPLMLHASVVTRTRAYLYSTSAKGATAVVVGLSTAL